MINFGQRLKKILLEKGIQQSKLAEASNLSRQQLSRLINQDQQPRNALELAKKISTVIDINTNWLAFGIGDMHQAINNSQLTVLYGDQLLETDLQIPVHNDDDFSELIAFRIDTTALSPEIQKGSIAIINKTTNPQDGSYILIKNNTKNLMIRKIYFATNGITLKSNIDSITCSMNDIEILGVVQEFRIIL